MTVEERLAMLEAVATKHNEAIDKLQAAIKDLITLARTHQTHLENFDRHREKDREAWERRHAAAAEEMAELRRLFANWLKAQANGKKS
jgi:DNA repair ATPase RecN